MVWQVADAFESGAFRQCCYTSRGAHCNCRQGQNSNPIETRLVLEQSNKDRSLRSVVVQHKNISFHRWFIHVSWT